MRQAEQVLDLFVRGNRSFFFAVGLLCLQSKRLCTRRNLLGADVPIRFVAKEKPSRRTMPAPFNMPHGPVVFRLEPFAAAGNCTLLDHPFPGCPAHGADLMSFVWRFCMRARAALNMHAQILYGCTLKIIPFGKMKSELENGLAPLC